MENSLEYLWFAGPSGSGKTTAVKNCFSDSKHVLRERLDIQRKDIVLCIESLDRNKYGDDMLDYLKSNYSEFVNPTIVIIDAQWPDIKEKECDTIRKFKNEKKDATHRLIWLNCSPKEAAFRCRMRGEKSWEEEYSENQARSHHEDMVRCVNRLLVEDIPVEVIDSSNYDYQISDWPSVEQYCNFT